jgi:hypothetical protein
MPFALTVIHPKGLEQRSKVKPEDYVPHLYNCYVAKFSGMRTKLTNIWNLLNINLIVQSKIRELS